MAEESFTLEEQVLIRRLGAAPQPELSGPALEAIRQRVLLTLDLPRPLPNPAPASPLLPAPVLVVVAVVVVILVIVTLLTRPVETPVPVAEVTEELTATATLTPTALATVTPTPTLTATATATLPALTPVTLVIEGPVESIAGNVVIVFGIAVTLNPDNPILGVLQTGDIIRVEGDLAGDDADAAIIAVSVTVVNVDVAVGEGGTIWRDDGTCQNPPPDWAPAHGWRRRCEGTSSSSKDSDKDQDKGKDKDGD